ncbi:MAG: DivIVA domain-containing protein [Actinomycetota bacterium]
MAMSYSRPDPASPAAIADATFGTGRRGFDQTEVREFLRMVAAELGRLQERERYLERELRYAQSNPDVERMQLDDQTLTRLLGEETVRVLAAARESASEIRTKAEANAAQLLGEAADEAARVREEADVEASRRRADAASDAEAELSMAKQQGREMVNEARAYRERVLSELARRRELAREQIEQLLHGRDRLMQSFERARLAAVDVVAELEPLGPPDEYVDLTPTTGPVPLTVPAGRTTPARPAADESVADTADEGRAADDPRVPQDDATQAEVTHQDELTHQDEVTQDVAGKADDTEHDSEHDTTANGATEPADAVDDVDASGDGGPADAVDQPDDEQVVEEPVADGLAADDEPADDGVADEAVADGPDSDDAAAGDDVVVDLFARLRAETTDDETTDDTITPADDSSVSPDAVEGDPVESDPAVAEHEPFAVRDAALTPLIVAAGRTLKRALADEQNEVLDALRRAKSTASLDDVIPATDALGDMLGDELHSAASAGASAVGVGEVDGEVAVAAGRKVLETEIIAPLRERIARAAADSDDDTRALTTAVRALYRQWKTQHIDDHLDDVLRTAYGYGIVEALPAGTTVAWMVDPGYPGSSDGDDDALADSITIGEEFPTGDLIAPGHLGCRCLLLPTDG